MHWCKLSVRGWHKGHLDWQWRLRTVLRLAPFQTSLQSTRWEINSLSTPRICADVRQPAPLQVSPCPQPN